MVGTSLLLILVLVGRGPLWLLGLLYIKEFLPWVFVLGTCWKLLFVLLLVSGNICFFKLPTSLALFKLFFISTPQKKLLCVCVLQITQ